MLRRDLEMKREGFDFSKALRALKEFVRRSTSAGVNDAAAGVFGMITTKTQISTQKNESPKKSHTSFP